MEPSLANWYQHLLHRYQPTMDALEQLGKGTREAGPLDAKHSHLVQLAAAAALRSEGAVHSHVRRALDGGASREEIEHAVLLTTTTVGFPTASAAMSWVEEVLRNRIEYSTA